MLSQAYVGKTSVLKTLGQVLGESVREAELRAANPKPRGRMKRNQSMKKKGGLAAQRRTIAGMMEAPDLSEAADGEADPATGKPKATLDDLVIPDDVENDEVASPMPAGFGAYGRPAYGTPSRTRNDMGLSLRPTPKGERTPAGTSKGVVQETHGIDINTRGRLALECISLAACSEENNARVVESGVIPVIVKVWEAGRTPITPLSICAVGEQLRMSVGW